MVNVDRGIREIGLKPNRNLKFPLTDRKPVRIRGENAPVL